MKYEHDITTNIVSDSHFGIGCASELLTVFDGSLPPRTVDLGSFNKSIITFGRSHDNDIVLSSMLVSRVHGRFVFRNGIWVIEDKGAFEQRGSENGLIYNNTSVLFKELNDGDLIRIDDGIETIEAGVLFVVSCQDSENKWESLAIGSRKDILIGRASDCDIVLPHISVSKHHARIEFDGQNYFIIDENSTNGVIVNDVRLQGKHRLHEKDVIVITNTKIIFTSRMLYYCCYLGGISVDVENVLITRKLKGRRRIVTGDDISLSIKPGELVAIIGGSGAGKSTILNCMCGYLAPTEGEVLINGVDLYENFDSIKKLIGYVPQSDIVFDNLTLYEMLNYTAKLRLPSDATQAEREIAIDRAIALVELDEKKNSFIKTLSGGQRKRASIAVELLSDPNLLFLDEPASGLDPGTERNLMHSLRSMADTGKTVILVTHSTLQLRLCDKIVFMGRGGKLCFFGSYQQALRFFNASDIIDVYGMINDNADYWNELYYSKALSATVDKRKYNSIRFRQSKKKMQLPILCSRYIKLVKNDKQRVLLLLIQAPLLALLISLVANGKQFTQYEMTKSILFALSCSAFWVGMLNSIQEICKERTILKREYMTGLSLHSYLSSKMIVLGFMCLLQSFMIIAVFAIAVGLPDDGVVLPPFWEMLITTFLTSLAATSMGLFVSSMFTNADRAMTVAPILLMPQILFSGLAFKLSGITEKVSWLAICRWSMEGYGSTANLNTLEMSLHEQGINIPHEFEAAYDFTSSHIIKVWLLILAFALLFQIVSVLMLRRIDKERT